MRTFRRWMLRLLALAALAGVGYGVYAIVRDGAEQSRATRGPVQPALVDLSAAQEKLGARMEVLRAGASGGRVRAALRGTQRARDRAVERFRARRQLPDPIPDEDKIDVALGAHFDYLDALRSVMTNRRSPLLRELAKRAQKAKDAFTDLPDSGGVEDGIRGTQAFLIWARARR